MDRILVIRLRKLGDCLMATPLLRQLRRIYVGASIDVLCEPASDVIFRNNPHVSDRLFLSRTASPAAFLRVALQLRKRKYGLVVDLQSLPKTAILARFTGAPQRLGFYRPWLRSRLTYTRFYRQKRRLTTYAAEENLRLLRDERVDLSDILPDLYVSPEDDARAAEFCARWLHPPVAAVYAKCHSSSDLWPHDKAAQVAERLARIGFQILLIYGPGEEQAAARLAERLSCEVIAGYPVMGVSTLKGVLQSCAIFVGQDGGPKHIATASGIPTLGLFGKITPLVWTPPGYPEHRFVAGRHFAGDLPADRQRVPYGRWTRATCLAELDVEEIWAEVRAMIDQGLVTGPRNMDPAEANV